MRYIKEELRSKHSKSKNDIGNSGNVHCNGGGLDYLQIFAEVLRVRHESGVFISFVEPGAASDFSRSLLPVHSVALSLLDMYIIPLSIHSYNYVPLLVSYCTINTRAQVGLNKV